MASAAASKVETHSALGSFRSSLNLDFSRGFSTARFNFKSQEFFHHMDLAWGQVASSRTIPSIDPLAGTGSKAALAK